MSAFRTCFQSCLMLVTLAAACTSPAGPSGPPALAGTIVARDRNTSIGGPPTVHVKQPVDEECGIIFLIRPSTLLQHRAADGTLRTASPADLTVGRRVAVWAEVILESCPAQAAATALQIIESQP